MFTSAPGHTQPRHRSLPATNMGDDPSLPTTTAASRDSFTAPAHAPEVRHQDGASLAPFEPPPARTCPGHDDAASFSAADGASKSPSTPLRISTDISPQVLRPPGLGRSGSQTANVNLSTSRALSHKASHNSLQPLSRTPSLRSSAARGLASTGGSSSVISSPVIAAMGDMTPLPSPLLSGDSPGPWRRLSIGSGSPPLVRARLASMGQVSVLVTNNGESVESAAANAPKRKMYATMDAADTAPHPAQPQTQPQSQPQHQPKNRSVSGYVPDAAGGAQRPVAASDCRSKTGSDDKMRRELSYAESRGLTPTVTQPPTPPPSESSRDSSDGSKLKDQGYEYFEARARGDRKMRRWRSIGFLGQGTFSQVILATSQVVPDGDSGESSAAGPTTPVTECSTARRRLVAIKVCEHGPRGGASEERVEMSLKRELEILQSIHHPSLVNLKAWSIEPTRAILVLSYSPGGDLFEVATAHRAVLTSSLLRRMFSELVGAVHYLHQRRIVHRDIKLESRLPLFPRAHPQKLTCASYRRPRQPEPGRARRPDNGLGCVAAVGRDIDGPRPLPPHRRRREARDAMRIGRLRSPRGHHGPTVRRPRH